MDDKLTKFFVYEAFITLQNSHNPKMFLNLNIIRNMLVIKLLLSNREDFENENEGGRLFYTFPRFPSKSKHRNV